MVVVVDKNPSLDTTTTIETVESINTSKKEQQSVTLNQEGKGHNSDPPLMTPVPPSEPKPSDSPNNNRTKRRPSITLFATTPSLLAQTSTYSNESSNSSSANPSDRKHSFHLPSDETDHQAPEPVIDHRRYIHITVEDTGHGISIGKL